MTAALIVHPAARLEIAAARSWYDDISTDLSNDFAEKMTEAIELIRRNPWIFADIGDGLHRAIVRRFPYHAFYRIGSARITILAVYHSHADLKNVLKQASIREANQ